MEIRLHTEATVESVLAESPDAVIVATGGRPHRPELPGFIQRLFGYGISGSIREQVMAVFYGNGANGKSVRIGSAT